MAYVVHDPYDSQSGSTWLGYFYGIAGVVLMLWLSAYGLRKRIYGSGSVKLQDWLSAHVYLGLALVVVVTLHTGFQLGWNVHTLAYALLCLVVVSGVFGVFVYIRYPSLMTENRRGQSLHGMMSELAEIDRECRDVSGGINDEINSLVLHSSQNTQLGGSILRQLYGKDPDCATSAAYDQVREIARTIGAEHAEAARALVGLLGKKRDLVVRARRHIQYQALMDVWLYFHVPLSFALIAAVVSHVLAVLIYL